MCTFSMYVWSSPLLIVVALVFLFHLLGVAVLISVVVLLLTVPFNIWITQQMDEVQDKRMAVKDERVKLMSEVLNGIKVVKFQA
ncbi:hypothetical protein QR680_009151 [Steinernema hermaphroditum]|uniref:ABC transmembrane type-1 domain-containing protein n=1 Tax=Steinernema hermaphroditum TaxID=289476 RepID=A0AA39M962_9BILA|nr:hypothetical protein QR680_009151 [Steinernema hermaphroditum]